MEKGYFTYCVFSNNKLETIYNNLNFALKDISTKRDSFIKPYLINSSINFEKIFYNRETKNFYNSKRFFYLEHDYVNLNESNKVKLKSNESNIVEIPNEKIDNDVDENELNLFIPLGNDFDEDYYNLDNDKKLHQTHEEKLSKEELLEKLRQKISNLKNLKEIEENDLSKIETMMENKKDNFNKNKIKFNRMKKQKDEKKEKYECLERKFKSDKNTYFKMKADINDGKLSSIPDLFKIKYDILTKMDKNNQLDNNNSLEIYLENIPYIQEVFTVEDEQLVGIFGEYYINDASETESSKDISDEDNTDFDTEDH